ncbi:g10305 [Coccomyxa elongata]
MGYGGRQNFKPSTAFLTPARAFLVCAITLVCLFYALATAFQGHISGTERSASSGTRLRLNGLDERGSGKERDVSALLQPTREHWHGPEDLDAAAVARADELNKTWMESPDNAAGSWWLEPGFHLSFMEDNPPYPFQRIKHVDGKDTGVMAIIAPFYDLDYYKAELARAFFWRLKANGHIIIIITSYQEFPGRIENPYDDRHTTPQDKMIHEAVDGYVHCFRDPTRFLPPGVPRILLSESDFHDPDRRDGGGSLVPFGLPKEYDLIYSNQGGDWNDYARNWTLAKASFKRLITELGIKVIIMGRDLTKEADHDLSPLISSGHIVSHGPSTPWKDFLRYIESSRVLIAPNVHDASPRVLVEALSLNVPILVNRHILGGWKYVNGQTGAFFDSEENVVQMFSEIRAKQDHAELRPRQWFRENWGKGKATLRLQAFLELAVGQDRLQAAQELVKAKVTYKR